MIVGKLDTAVLYYYLTAVRMW